MPIPSLSLEGKVAIVTGARTGNGKAIALTLAEAGADVAVCDVVVDDGLLEAVAKEIRGFGQRALTVQVDISRKSDVDNMVQKVIDEFGAIDILVNNAGILILGDILEFPEEDWDKMFDINLKGYYLCSQAVGKRMVERKGGNIINLASASSFRFYEEEGPYCTAKTGVVMLTRALARELASYHIRVNGIAPAWVKTELTRDVWSDPVASKEAEAEIPLGRWLEPSDVANAALFLASDLASGITGTTIVVDGGTLA